MGSSLDSSRDITRSGPRHSDAVHLEWLENLGLNSFAGLRLLDLGCGSGYLAHMAKSKGASVSIGVDIEKPKDGIFDEVSWQFVEANLDRDDWLNALPSKPFDIILAFDIIEHLRSPVAFLEQCRNLLSPQGSLYLTTPNTQSLERLLNPEGWSGAFDPQHRILFSKYSLGFLLRKTGLQAIQLRAPMRSLRWLPRAFQPPIGGQLLVQAGPAIQDS